MRYKSLERRRLAVDSRVERATTVLQKMARMWGVTASTGRERFRSLRCVSLVLRNNNSFGEPIWPDTRRAFMPRLVDWLIQSMMCLCVLLFFCWSAAAG